MLGIKYFMLPLETYTEINVAENCKHIHVIPISYYTHAFLYRFPVYWYYQFEKERTMAKIQILAPEDIQARDAKPQRGIGRGRRRNPEREAIITSYKALLEPTTPGYGGDVTLEAEDDKRIVQQNLRLAADELGLILTFRPIKDKQRIHFRIITPEQKAAQPKRGGGRPRKRAA